MARISTSALHFRTVNDITTLQANLAKTQKQISSGQKAETFVELGTQINRIHDLEASVKSASRFRDANTVALTRLKSMDIAVAQIQDAAEKLSQSMPTENSPGANIFDLKALARATLDTIESALNTTQAGRSLFAGSKTNQPAVDKLRDVVSVNSDGSANAAYYRGDSFRASVQASDTLNVEYGITADEQAFQDIIGALHKAVALDESGSHTDALQADVLLQRAIQGLADIRTRVNNDIVTLNEANKHHDRVELQLNEVLNEMTGTDIVSASIEAALNEATLTATMQTFVRVSSLSLVDFLR